MAQFSQRPFDLPLQGMQSQISLPPSPPRVNASKEALHTQMLPSNAPRGSDDSKRSKGISLSSLLGRRNSSEKTTKSRSQFPLRGESRGTMLTLYPLTDMYVQLGTNRRSAGRSQILSRRSIGDRSLIDKHNGKIWLPHHCFREYLDVSFTDSH